jgi:hypothetical protein
LDDEAFMVDLEEVTKLDVKQVTLAYNLADVGTG